MAYYDALLIIGLAFSAAGTGFMYAERRLPCTVCALSALGCTVAAVIFGLVAGGRG